MIQVFARALTACAAFIVVVAAYAGTPLTLTGSFTQGGMVVGKAPPGSAVTLDDNEVRVAADGRFVFGFGRDASPEAVLRVIYPDGTIETRTLDVSRREYRIERIDGLPSKMVTPPKETLERIRREADRIRATWARDSDLTYFAGPFRLPAEGRISGVYGSQRILNGEPRRPHYGLDVAGPEGDAVVAPAAGTIALAVTDYYFTGGTVIIDHGHGISSLLMHLSRVDVSEGETVEAGDPIGAIGMTGRATGPHVDWRVNWFGVRLDPGLLVDLPETGETR